MASVRYGFESLDLERIISFIQPANVASRRVAEKAGLTARGETRWKDSDVILYAVDRDAWEAKADGLTSSVLRRGPAGCPL